MRQAVICLLLILVPTSSLAASITLDECIIQAKQYNPSLKVVRSDLKIAKATVRQNDAGIYPRIDAQLGYTMQPEAQAMKVNGTGMETQQPTYLSGSLIATYTIYDFGRREARRNTSRANLEALQYTINDHEQDVSLQVTNTYLALLQANKYLTAARDEQRMVEEHRRVAEALYQAGSVTRNDLLQAEVRLAHARQQVLSHQNQIENLYLHLNFMTGSPAENRPELKEPVIPIVSSSTADPALALRRRYDLNALRKGLEVTEQEQHEAQSAFYPELFARLGVEYLENNKLREQTIYAGTIGIKFNLFDGFSSTAVHSKAVASSIRAKEQLLMGEQQAALEIAAAGNDLRVAAERIKVTQEAIRQAEENLRINKNRYEERVGTATEVLDAQTLLTQAKTEHFRATYDQQRAAVRLRKATGEL